MMLKITIAFLTVSCCFSAPIDDPIRIELPVYEQPQSNSDVLLAYPIQPENYPGGELLKNDHKHTYSHSTDTVHSGGIFDAPVTQRETVLLETEGHGSKALSFKEHIQNGYAGIFQPKPIVDTISESEKYGNTGDKFYTAGKAIVGGAEKFSNFVNGILEIPSSLVKKITTTATDKLNNFGGKLIGL